MKKILVLGFITLFLLTGCGTVSQFTAKTVASVSPGNGFNYSSNKNQENLEATGEMGPDGLVKFSIKTTASTPEAAIMAAAKAQADATQALVNVLNSILPIVQSAVQGAIVGGGPGAAAGAAAKILTTPKTVPAAPTIVIPTVPVAPATPEVK